MDFNWTTTTNRTAKAVVEPITRSQEARLPIKIDTDFQKSKRNLLWGSSIALVLAISHFFTVADSCLQFPFLGNLALPTVVLSGILLIYCAYAYANFSYQIKRVQARNSDPFINSSENDLEGYFDVIGKQLKNLQDQFGLIDANVSKEALKTFSNIREAKFAPMLRKNEATLSDLGLKIEDIKTSLGKDKRLKAHGSGERIVPISEELENAFNVLSALQTVNNEATKDLKSIDQTLLNFQYEGGKVENFEQRLNDIQTSVVNIETAFRTLSSGIRSSDRLKFRWLDDVATKVMFTLAIAGTIYIGADFFFLSDALIWCRSETAVPSST